MKISYYIVGIKMWNNQKQQKIVFPYVKLTNLLSF